MIRAALGCTVLYTSQAGKVRPAMIVAVHPSGLVNLTVFTDWRSDSQDPEFAHGSTNGAVWLTSKAQSDTPEPGKWCAKVG